MGFSAAKPCYTKPGSSRRNKERAMKEFQALDDQLSRPVSFAPPESETLRVLRKGRERIEQGWVRHSLAIDDRGRGVSPESAAARAWCALGAIGWFFED